MPYSYYPVDVLPDGFCVVSAENDLLFSDDGTSYIDLLCGCGAVLLGHRHPAIVSKLREQLESVWITGAVPTRAQSEAQAEVEGFFPPSHQLAGLYSTGMEAAEFALRIARRATGRRGVIGFEGHMHGKSTATARLGWPNELVTLPDVNSLPYPPRCSEDAALEGLRDALAEGDVACVFLEPLLGSSGGHAASAGFLAQVSSLCAEQGSLLVVDEIFTGFHRTGPAFLHQALEVTPDIVLVGKAMGNGFPVSGVVVDRRHQIETGMFPGSTFAGNPLAACAAAATLHEMRALDLGSLVAGIEQTITTRLKDLEERGIALRGRGALWTLEFPPAVHVPDVARRIVEGGVVAAPTGAYIRLLPPATITPEHLERACEVIREACL